MQIVETANKNLTREFNIKVAQDDVKKKVRTRLEQIGLSVKLPGFRPGKVPLPILEQRFAAGARSEVIDQTVSEASQKALKDRNLRPATQPQIELISFGEGQDLEFKLAVEILPEIKPGDFSTILLERITSDVEDAAIEDAIREIAKSSRQTEPVTEKRGAKIGDTLVINFDGSVDGEKKPGMKGEDYSLELGTKSFIDTFEDQLVGAKAGDEKLVKVTFPAAYHATELAGKKAEFEVKVKELRKAKPVELNDELAKELGLESYAELKNRIAADLAADYARVSRALLKRALLDRLAEMHDYDLPPGMVDAEFKAIWSQVEDSKKRGELTGKDATKSDDELQKEYRAIAERRIKLGLLLAEVARSNTIEVSPNELRNAMIAEARRFPGQEKAVVEYYTKTEGALERLRSPILEDKVVDHILEKAKISETKLPAEELVKLPQQMD